MGVDRKTRRSKRGGSEAAGQSNKRFKGQSHSRKLIEEEVEKRINEEFERRVKEESNRRFVEKVTPQSEWYKGDATSLILELYFKIEKDVLKALQGPWKVECDECGEFFTMEFSTDEVESLIRRGYVQVECPSCKDSLLVWSRKHKIKLKLKDLLEYYLLG